MFINTGALLQSKTPNEIIGIIAHEAGHLAAGHQHRMRDQLARSQVISVIGALLGAGAVVASKGTSNNSMESGVALLLGGSHIATRHLLSYIRSEERSADRAALSFWKKLDTLQKVC